MNISKEELNLRDYSRSLAENISALLYRQMEMDLDKQLRWKLDHHLRQEMDVYVREGLYRTLSWQFNFKFRPIMEKLFCEQLYKHFHDRG